MTYLELLQSIKEGTQPKEVSYYFKKYTWRNNGNYISDDGCSLDADILKRLPMSKYATMDVITTVPMLNSAEDDFLHQLAFINCVEITDYTKIFKCKGENGHWYISIRKQIGKYALWDYASEIFSEFFRCLDEEKMYNYKNIAYRGD